MSPLDAYIYIEYVNIYTYKKTQVSSNTKLGATSNLKLFIDGPFLPDFAFLACI